jgi:Fructose-1-6-bisphosphatase, C-terminal domain
MGFVVEQAGGRASTGVGRVLELEAKEYHQRAAVILGSPDDVALAEDFYRKSKYRTGDNPGSPRKDNDHGSASEGDSELVRE